MRGLPLRTGIPSRSPPITITTLFEPIVPADIFVLNSYPYLPLEKITQGPLIPQVAKNKIRPRFTMSYRPPVALQEQCLSPRKLDAKLHLRLPNITSRQLAGKHTPLPFVSLVNVALWAEDIPTVNPPLTVSTCTRPPKAFTTFMGIFAAPPNDDF